MFEKPLFVNQRQVWLVSMKRLRPKAVPLPLGLGDVFVGEPRRRPPSAGRRPRLKHPARQSTPGQARQRLIDEKPQPLSLISSGFPRYEVRRTSAPHQPRGFAGGAERRPGLRTDGYPVNAGSELEDRALPLLRPVISHGDPDQAGRNPHPGSSGHVSSASAEAQAPAEGPQTPIPSPRVERGFDACC